MAAPLRTAAKGAGRSAPSLCRGLAIFSPAKAQVQPINQPVADTLPPLDIVTESIPPPKRRDARAFFDTTGVLWVGTGGDKPPDPNKAKLGKTLRILQERMPTLLQSPLPQDILAPNISLHLFPSTHPHLPTVSGRVAYNAALWTSPIAWNRVPIIGNVKIEVLAERMTSEPLTFLPRRQGAMAEQLVVRWCEKTKSDKDEGSGSSVARSLRMGRGVDASKAFTGLFIFDFDQEGRILSHTIETAQGDSNSREKGMGARFVGLTDWLLGGIRDPGAAPVPMFQRVDRR
ncbi:uncharacterized protein J7T54_005468 [Emericellopsis cladophorae]|uniref:Chromosome transmission fidelity protein 4 n=1 Tax=Emericellopsis cladophorae TaxID=2686198 RepID=A0A9Q0BD20_9HYPO|nr:uncharacterized protein J7T54_005468 [Emericellopsis cladophorae]KAI6780366.1 hypothetical protein J7T54_005468 [Emericellopsis cladophorae]